MGHVGRLSALALAVCALGCSAPAKDAEQVEQVRQERLKPRDIRAELAKLREAERVTNPDGSLIPSNEVVAGITLPRGLTVVNQLPGQWYYQSPASLEVLRAYFGPRLFTGQIQTGGRGTVTYVNAQPKDEQGQIDKQHMLSVRIGPAPSDPRQNEIYLSEVKRNPVGFPSEAEVRAQIEARRKYAD